MAFVVVAEFGQDALRRSERHEHVGRTPVPEGEPLAHRGDPTHVALSVGDAHRHRFGPITNVDARRLLRPVPKPLRGRLDRPAERTLRSPWRRRAGGRRSRGLDHVVAPLDVVRRLERAHEPQRGRHRQADPAGEVGEGEAVGAQLARGSAAPGAPRGPSRRRPDASLSPPASFSSVTGRMWHGTARERNAPGRPAFWAYRVQNSGWTMPSSPAQSRRFGADRSFSAIHVGIRSQLAPPRHRRVQVASASFNGPPAGYRAAVSVASHRGRRTPPRPPAQLEAWGTAESARLPALVDVPEWPLPVGPGGAVVIAPHPDDETLGTGGLLARLLERGWQVFVIELRHGSGSRHRRRSRQQALTARAVADAEPLP